MSNIDSKLNIHHSLKQGFLYVAIGQSYVLEAIESAKTLKKCDPTVSIALVSNTEIGQEDVFDSVIVQSFDEKNSEDAWKLHMEYKTLGMKFSPYEKTIFLDTDTDTYIYESIEHLFLLLNYNDMLICPDYAEGSLVKLDGVTHHGYVPYNTGVIGYKKNERQNDFFDLWLKEFKININDYRGQQPSFIIALMQKDLKVYSLPSVYNFRIKQFISIHKGTVKIFHGRHSNMSKVSQLINSTNRHRGWNPNKWKLEYWGDKPFQERLMELFDSVKRLV